MVVETVTCASCGTVYEATAGMAKSRQAYRCAAEVSGNTVTGFYGSTVIDMEEWVFPDGRPESVKEGVICDPCIVRRQEEGVLVRNRVGVW